MKTHRERRFPLELMKKGYIGDGKLDSVLQQGIRIEKAEASEAKDKRRILNSIAKKQDLDSEPDPQDPEFEKVNKILRSIIAEHAVNQSAKAGQQKETIEVVCADTEREKLTLDFSNCQELSDVSALAALGNLKKITQLTLDFVGCSKLSDVSSLAALGNLQKLEQLRLSFAGCSKLSDVSRTQMKALNDSRPGSELFF